jgi:predicted porin
MQKKALVLAVGAALVMTGAYAQKGGDFAGDADSVVEMYGKVYPELVIPQGFGATAATETVSTLTAKPQGTNSVIKRTEMASSNSRIGWRGYEKLGGNLRAIWQLETEFHIDSNDTAFAQRDSFVGMSHPVWGTIKLGRMDTPFKTYGDEVSFLGVSSGNFVSSSNVLRKAGFGTNSASSFHLRRANVVQYESPKIAGFDATAQYSTDEADTSGNNKRAPHVWSGAARYELGPLEFSAAYEEHWDLFGGSRNVPTALSNFNDTNVRSKDKATQVMARYKLGRHTFEADYIWKKYDENATVTGRFLSYKNTAWQVLWDARWSNAWRTGLQYIKANQGSCSRVNASCDTGGLDGSQLQAGVAYYFSRRTYAFLMAAWLKNGKSATYNNLSLQTPSVGEDVDQYALGISHNF